MRREWLRFLLGLCSIALLSALQIHGAWRHIREWPAHVGGDTSTYSYYAAQVFSGQPYTETISDPYFFRTWGYPWIIWQVIRDESPKHKPAGGYTSQKEMEWTKESVLYRRLADRQAAATILLPLSACIICFLMRRKVWLGLLGGLSMMAFPAAINYARWVVPETLSCIVYTVSLAGFSFSVYARNWWASLLAAVATGLAIAFAVLLRMNFVIIIPVIWIALSMVAAGLLVIRLRDRQVWYRLLLVGLGVTIPYGVVIQASLIAKKQYGGATQLSDGLARMGCNIAARCYKDLDPARLDPEVEAVRQYMMTLPPPPEDPKGAYPAVMYYMNRNAFALRMTPAEFRENLAALNLAVIKNRPWYWIRTYVVPAWREEMAVSRIESDAFRIPELRRSWAGRLYLSGLRISSLINQLIDPTVLLVLSTLFLLVVWRADWRACLLVLVMTGGHFASLLVSSLLGIPANGRYRFVTEPGAWLVLVLAGAHLACLLKQGMWRIIAEEVMPRYSRRFPQSTGTSGNARGAEPA